MRKEFIVPPVKERHSNISFLLYNADNGEYKAFSGNTELGNKLHKYKYTILYKNDETQTVVLIYDNRYNKPSVQLTSYSHMTVMKDKIYNYDKFKDSNEVQNISVDELKNITNNTKGHFRNIMCFIDSKMSSKQNMLEYLDKKSKGQAKTEEKIEEPKEVLEDTEELACETEKIAESTEEKTNNIPTELNEALLKLTETTAELKQTIKGLEDEKREYKEALCRFKGIISPDSLEIEEKIIGVSSINKFDNNNVVEKQNVEYNLYTMILKILNVNDSISIPREVYDNLKVSIRRNLNVSINSGDYISIIEIHFEDMFNILAKVDYRYNSNFVRVDIVKKYSNEYIKESEVVDYEIAYNQWKRRNNFSVSEK